MDRAWTHFQFPGLFFRDEGQKRGREESFNDGDRAVGTGGPGVDFFQGGVVCQAVQLVSRGGAQSQRAHVLVETHERDLVRAGSGARRAGGSGRAVLDSSGGTGPDVRRGTTHTSQKAKDLFKN